MNQAAMDLVDDYTASYWIKKAVVELDKRDPIDVLKDLETLHSVFEMKISELYSEEL